MIFSNSVFIVRDMFPPVNLPYNFNDFGYKRGNRFRKLLHLSLPTCKLTRIRHSFFCRQGTSRFPLIHVKFHAFRTIPDLYIHCLGISGFIRIFKRVGMIFL